MKGFPGKSQNSAKLFTDSDSAGYYLTAEAFRNLDPTFDLDIRFKAYFDTLKPTFDSI